MTLFLRDDLKKHWQGKDPFLQVQTLQGKIYRHKEGRTTLQTNIDNNSYFLKVHRGIGWKEIFKNLSQLRLPIIGASNEYLAANKLTSLHVDTLTPVAFGKKGLNPAKQLSFILTEDLSNTISLEDYCANWRKSPPSFIQKKALIELLATVSQIMHRAGINHRDYYICHFLLDKETLATPSKPRCFLIDLHRAQLRKEVPLRWAVKDIAGLYFSAMAIGLTKRDCFRFMKIYHDTTLATTLNKYESFWSSVNKTSIRLFFKDHQKSPPHQTWWQ